MVERLLLGARLTRQRDHSREQPRRQYDFLEHQSLHFIAMLS